MWKDLMDEYSREYIKFIERHHGPDQYFTLEHLLWMTEEDQDDECSDYSRNYPKSGPKIYIGISPIGSGKIILLNWLTDPDLHIIMGELELDVFHQPSIFS